LPAGTLLTCAAHEFGTEPPLEVLQALRFDHYLHVHGKPDPSRLAVQKAIVRNAFCPMDQEWQDAVLNEARCAIESVLSVDG
jgi:hypothetical protein